MFSPIVLMSAGFLIGFFAYPYLADIAEEMDDAGDDAVENVPPSSPAVDKASQPMTTPIETLVNETDIFSESTAIKADDSLPTAPINTKVESPNALQKINGVGPTYAKRLFEGGIRSIAAIAASDVETLTNLSKIQEWQKPGPAEWIEEAKVLLN